MSSYCTTKALPFSVEDEKKRKATSVVGLKEESLDAKYGTINNFNVRSYFPDCQSHDGSPSLRVKTIPPEVVECH